MPTKNISFRLPIEPSEYEQWKGLSKMNGVELTVFIRQAVRAKIRAMGYIPSDYPYTSGGKKQK